MDQILDAFVDGNSVDLSLYLLQLVSHPSQGGRGYHLSYANPWLEWDGWEVNHSAREITLDTHGVYQYGHHEIASHLRDCLEVEFLQSRLGVGERFAWGTGKVLLGTVETVIGMVGILVPEPGTTVAGVAAVTLGVNTVVDGVSQIGGANLGRGVNLLETAFSAAGSALADVADLDPSLGGTVGRGVFMVSSVALGSWASLKVLRITGKPIFRSGVGGQPGGFSLGRVDALYTSNSARDGVTIFSITNNKGQSILRFVTHEGQLMVNARIVGTTRLLVHESNPKAILKGLLKLLAHGAKY